MRDKHWDKMLRLEEVDDKQPGILVALWSRCSHVT